MFDDLKLVGKYGSWVKVQVAFYDFIFEIGTKLCPKHWKEQALQPRAFSDGNDFYDKSISLIEEHFLNFDAAWEAFIENEIGDI